MKIAIDGLNLAKNKTGIDFMTDGIIKGFTELEGHEVVVYTGTNFDGNFKGGKSKVEVVKLELGGGFLGNLGGGLRWYRRAAAHMRKTEVDIFISTWTLSAGFFFPKTVQIVPDLSPIVHPGNFPIKHRFVYRFTLLLAMRMAWRVVTISETMRSELNARYPWYKKEIGVIPLSCNDWILEDVSQDKMSQVRSKYGLPENYILSISTIQPRKNYKNMLIGFKQFLKQNPSSNLNYIIIGQKGWYYQEVFDRVERLGLQSRVRFLGYVPDEDMAAILLSSKGLMYASLYEGFGIPMLNALVAGVPVLASDLPVFREFGEFESCVFVNPLITESVASGIGTMLQMKNVSPRIDLLEKYSWKNAAIELLDAGRPEGRPA